MNDRHENGIIVHIARMDQEYIVVWPREPNERSLG